MKIILSVPILIFLAASAHAALPGDGADGKRLHDANCMSCHDTAVYTRKGHSVKSLDDLKQQFEGCSHMAKKDFSPTEAQNIMKYLNDQFYRFQ